MAPLQSPYQTYLDRLAPSTRATAAYRLTTIAAMLWPGVPAPQAPWHELVAGALLGLRAQLVERYRFDTAANSNYLATAKGTLKAAWLLGMVGTDVWRRAAEVEAPKGVAPPAGHYVDDEDWSRLFASIAQDTSVRGVRDLAIFALLRGSGCRWGELLALDLDDWDHKRAVLRFRTAKGGRQRESACPAWVQGPMAAYLRLRGPVPGPLFVKMPGSTLAHDERLSKEGLWFVFKGRVTASGLGHLTPHDTRRGYVSSALEAGIDPIAVARQVGPMRPCRPPCATTGGRWRSFRTWRSACPTRSRSSSSTRRPGFGRAFYMPGGGCRHRRRRTHAEAGACPSALVVGMSGRIMVMERAP